MRCFVGLLLLGLCIGVDAHNTPKIKRNERSHTPTEGLHYWALETYPAMHWHFSPGEAGAWDQCVADAYDEAQDDYNLVGGNCVDDDDKMTDSEANVPTLPPSTPTGDSNTPPTIHPEVPRDDTQRESENLEQNTVSMEALAFTYDHTFPAGVSLQHIPLDIVDFNKSGIAVNSVPGVFDQLGESVASLIASRGASGWTYVTYPNFPAHNAIWKSIGFIAVMDEEVTVQIEGTFGGWTGQSPTAYQILYLRRGRVNAAGCAAAVGVVADSGGFLQNFLQRGVGHGDRSGFGD